MGYGLLEDVAKVAAPVVYYPAKAAVSVGKKLAGGGDDKGVIGGIQEDLFGAGPQALTPNTDNFTLGQGVEDNPYIQDQTQQIQGAVDQSNQQYSGITRDASRTADQYADQFGQQGDYYQQQAEGQATDVMRSGEAMQHNAYQQGRSAITKGTKSFDTGQGIINTAGQAQGREGAQLDQSSVGRALSQADQARGMQLDSAGALARNAQAFGDYAAQGPGASQAQAQLDQATSRNLAQNVALARSGSGWGGGATAMNRAVEANALAQQQAAGQGSILRAQEADAWRGRQLQAMQGQTGALGTQNQALSSVRGQDFSGGTLGLQAASTQAGLDDAQLGRNDAQQLGLLSAGTNLQNTGNAYLGTGNAMMGRGDAAYLGTQQLGANIFDSSAGNTLAFGQAGLGAQQYATQADLAGAGAQSANTFGGLAMEQGLASEQAQLAADQEALRVNSNLQAQIGAQNSKDKGLGGILGLASGMIASDINLKTDIREADESLLDMDPFLYSYIDDKWGKGEFLGFMAQDLEKTSARGAVIDTPEGKMVDTGRLSLANTAGLSLLNTKIKKLQAELERLAD